MTPTSVLQERVQAGLVALRPSDYPLLKLLTKVDEYQNNYKFPVNVSTTGATGVASTANAPAASSDTVVGASLPIGDFRFSHTITLLKNDIEQAARIGVEPLKNLVQAHVDVALQRIMRGIEQAIFTGTGNAASGGIIGLSTAVAATGSYAGIDPAVSGREAWSSYSDIGSVNRAWSEQLYAAAKFGIMAKGGMFDIIVGDPDTVSEFEKLYIADGRAYFENTGAKRLASLGYNTFEYAGRPVIVDLYCPANTLYFLNTQTVKLATRAIGSEGGTRKMEGLNVLISELPSANAGAKSWEVCVYPQLIVSNRIDAGVIANTIPD
jgi:hypothetical protein